MRTSMLVAIVAMVGVLAVAGLAVAASPKVASSLGLQSGQDSGRGTCGQADGGHMWQNQWSYKYANNSDGCPMGYDYNYSWDREYQFDNCSADCPMEHKWNYSYNHERDGCSRMGT